MNTEVKSTEININVVSILVDRLTTHQQVVDLHNLRNKQAGGKGKPIAIVIMQRVLGYGDKGQPELVPHFSILKEEKFDHTRSFNNIKYWIEEHTCPTNFLSDVQEQAVWYSSGRSETDVHGMYDVVGYLTPEILSKITGLEITDENFGAYMDEMHGRGDDPFRWPDVCMALVQMFRPDIDKNVLESWVDSPEDSEFVYMHGHDDWEGYEYREEEAPVEEHVYVSPLKKNLLGKSLCEAVINLQFAIWTGPNQRKPATVSFLPQQPGNTIQEALNALVDWCVSNAIPGFPMIHQFVKETNIGPFSVNMRDMGHFPAILHFKDGQVDVEYIDGASRDHAVYRDNTSTTLGNLMDALIKRCSATS